MPASGTCKYIQKRDTMGIDTSVPLAPMVVAYCRPITSITTPSARTATSARMFRKWSIGLGM